MTVEELRNHLKQFPPGATVEVYECTDGTFYGENWECDYIPLAKDIITFNKNTGTVQIL